MFKVITNHIVAIESPDHISTLGPEPTGGPSMDNSRNRNFNTRLYQLVGKPSVLDLGCSGGGFVKDCVDDGLLAVGLEGSDYSAIRQRAEWATIPQNLFTCDCTKSFQIIYNDEPFVFNIVTAWEFAEHIAEKDWPILCENVRKHLKKDGLWIMSISERLSDPNGPQFHQTVHPKDWWLEMFKKEGFENQPELINHFNGHYVRGDDMSFHVVLKHV